MTPGPRALVVGLGSPDRGDDALGALVAAGVAQALPAAATGSITVVAHEDPTNLIDLLEPVASTGRPEVLVVVDAVRGPGVAGTLVSLEVGPGADEVIPRRNLDPGPAGTHGFGLAGAIELARVLGRLPARVVVIGVLASGFEPGAAVSGPVADAVPGAVAAALDVLREAAVLGPTQSEPAASSNRRCRSEANPAPASA